MNDSNRPQLDRRDGGKRHRWRSWNIYPIIRFIIMVMIISIAVMFVIITFFAYKNGEFLVDQVAYYDEQLENYENQVKKIQSEEQELLIGLYETVKLHCTSSDDEALQMLWRYEFPADTFPLDSSDAIKLYALLENHDDIRYSVDVAQCLWDLECTRTHLSNRVDSYNIARDSYVFWTEQHSHSLFAYLLGGKPDKTKWASMVLQ